MFTYNLAYETSSHFLYNQFSENIDSRMSSYELLLHEELYQSIPNTMVQSETFVCPADVYRECT